MILSGLKMEKERPSHDLRQCRRPAVCWPPEWIVRKRKSTSEQGQAFDMMAVGFLHRCSRLLEEHVAACRFPCLDSTSFSV
jgi:hypothetical protein